MQFLHRWPFYSRLISSLTLVAVQDYVVSLARRPGLARPHRLRRICAVRWAACTEVASRHVGASASCRLGRDRGTQRLDLPADTVGELASGTGGRKTLSRRLHRVLPAPNPLSTCSHQGGTSGPGACGRTPECRRLLVALAQTGLSSIARSLKPAGSSERGMQRELLSPTQSNSCTFV